MNDIRMMKPLSLLFITLLFACGCAYGQAVDTLCHIDKLPSIHFNGISKKLDRKARQTLDGVAALLNLHKGCIVTVGLWVNGDWHGGKRPNYLLLSWNRTKAIVDYLLQKGFDESRVHFASNNDDSLDDVNLRPSIKKDIPISRGIKTQRDDKSGNAANTSTNRLQDSDSDGIADQFDLEPHTPANAEVDTHGRAVDTDGDGVPDYLDKEKLTPQQCFPVNKDGVGFCPDPSCCKEISNQLSPGIIDYFGCVIDSFPSINFSKGQAKLNKASIAALQKVAEGLRNHPYCNVRVSAWSVKKAKAKQLAWGRVNVIIGYLVEKQGIAEARIIFNYDNDGNTDTVKLEPTTETGPNSVPRP